VRITLPSGTPAEIARVDGATTGLVICPDIMGLRQLFDDHVARLSAENGWTVCAVEPFPGREDMPVSDRLDRGVAAIADDRLLGDLVAAADETGCARVGVIGFCMGGMYALKAAGTGRFDRAVAFYGMIRVPQAFRGPGHGEPLDAVSRAEAAPVLAIIGGQDHWTPEADVNALRAKGAEVVVYPEADHGFVHDPDRLAHRADDASDAWRRATEFLSS
jgi:carboxymethylenebutenolidase